MIDLAKLRHLDKVLRPESSFFYENYGFKSIPVVISGLSEEWKTATWSLNFLRERVGDIQVYGEKPDNDWKSFTVAEYISYMENCPDEEPYYLVNCEFHRSTELTHHYRLPDYFQSWLRNMTDGKWPFFSWVYMGARNTFSPLHLDVWDTSAWNLVISGKKLWLFYPHDETEYLYDGQVNPFKPDFAKYPYFKRATPVYCIQNPGEIVFTPSRWWHAVYNLEYGVSITENFVNETNYNVVCELFRKRRMFKELSMLTKYAENQGKESVTLD